MTVYAPDRQTVVAQLLPNAEGVATTPRGGVPLVEDGTYYLAVAAEGNYDPLHPVDGDGFGAYSLKVACGNPAALSPELYVADSQVAFGEVEVGSWATATVQLANRGGTDLTISELLLSDCSPFLAPYDPVLLPIVLAPGDSIDLRIGVCLTEPGTVTDGLIVVCDDPNQQLFALALEATGVQHSMATTMGARSAWSPAPWRT